MFDVYTKLDPLAKFIVDSDPDASSAYTMEKEAMAQRDYNDFFPKMGQTMSFKPTRDATAQQPPPPPPIETDIQGDAPKPQPIPDISKEAPKLPTKAPNAPKLPTYEPKPEQKLSMAMLNDALYGKQSQKLPPVTPAFQTPDGPGGTFKKPKKKKDNPEQKVGFVMLQEALYGKRAQFGGIRPQQPGKPIKPIAKQQPVKGSLAGTQVPKPMASSPSASEIGTPGQGNAPKVGASSPSAKKMKPGAIKQAGLQLLEDALYGGDNV